MQKNRNNPCKLKKKNLFQKMNTKNKDSESKNINLPFVWINTFDIDVNIKNSIAND